jgi:hypothetical protein
MVRSWLGHPVTVRLPRWPAAAGSRALICDMVIPRRHEARVDDFQPQAGDPLHEPGQGGLIRQLGAKGRHIRADGDLAVIEFRAQRGACLAREGDLVGL